MKKVLFLFLMCLPMILGAQVEMMSQHKIKADQMIGTGDATAWISKHVSIVETNDGKVGIVLYMDGHIFIDKPFRVGFYDEKDNLIYICDRWSCQTEDDRQSARLVDSGFSNSKIEGSSEIGNNRYLVPRETILKYLKESKGYIRFVTTTYGGHIYDIKASIKK